MSHFSRIPTAKADLVEGAIGELSPFHELNGYYAEGIHVDTAVLPDGWRDRLVNWDLLSSDPARPQFLEPHDLAVAKLAAGREKDTAFVDALIRADLMRVAIIRDRAHLLPRSDDGWLDPRIRGWLDVFDGGRGRR